MTHSTARARARQTQEPTAPRSRRVQSVDHAIDILRALAEAGQGAGLSTIAHHVELSKATVYHLLGTLESRRFVVRDAETGRYRLSWGLYELGSAVVRSVDLTRTARHHLDRLAAQTGESVLLGILDEDSVLYLDRGDAPSGFRMVASAGRRSPLHSTASGKVLLAFAQDPALVPAIVSRPLAKLTTTTITDPKRLRRELAQVRQQGYATCWQEREVGLCSVAVPVRDYSGAVIASLAIAAPSTRLNTRTVHQTLVPLRAAAQTIGSELGHAAGEAVTVDGAVSGQRATSPRPALAD